MYSITGRRDATHKLTSCVLFSVMLSAATLAAVATAQAQHNHMHGGSHRAGHGPSRSDPPAVAEYKAAHERMMRAMDLPYTGDPDVDFRVHMIPHHAGAMDMARIAMRHAKDPWTRQLAESVIYEQQREIAEMQGWLSRRGVVPPLSGQPYHVWTPEFVRTDVIPPGTQSELVGKSWAPGTGVLGTE